jgi:hypothetical protein
MLTSVHAETPPGAPITAVDARDGAGVQALSAAAYAPADRPHA